MDQAELSSDSQPRSAYWDMQEYKAGYAARFGGSLEVLTAGHSWCMGWQDADTELLESQLTNAGQDEDYRQTGAHLYYVGRQARLHDLPFDERRTTPWKLGWVDADISVGTVELTHT